MKRHFLLFGLLFVLFSACTKTSFNATTQATIDDNKIKSYIAANHLSTMIKDPSGVYYSLVKQDTAGAHPTLTDTIQVSYTGKLLNGTVFDTESATVFPLTSVVKGWQIAIPYMTYNVNEGQNHVYSRIRLIIPSALGYGSVAQTGGNVDIPANSVLDFTIDLIGYYPYP